MISDKEAKKIDALDLVVFERGVPFNDIAEGYAGFLLEAVRGEFATSRMDSYERRIVCAFLKARLAGSAKCSSAVKKDLISSRLWVLERKWRKSRGAFSALIRCVICCYGSEEQWLKDDLGEETPLGVYLFFLKNFNPQLADSFFIYFERKFSK